ncbi:hypothetical protein RLOatenuis_2260 [Rickettsiales bacterium]|nr:hypothetical protein RLOatenuis_2260 [Rickettsiales bacterium]
MSADDFPDLQTEHNIALKKLDDLESLTDNLDNNQKSLASFAHKMQKHKIKHNVGPVLLCALQINSYLDKGISKAKVLKNTFRRLLPKGHTQEESPESSEEQSLEKILEKHMDETYFVIAPAGLSLEPTNAILRNSSKETILAYLPTANNLVVDYTSIDERITFNNSTAPEAASEATRSADAASSKKQPNTMVTGLTIPLKAECCLIANSTVAFKLGNHKSVCSVLSQFIAALDSSDLSEKQLKEASEDPNYYLNYFLAALLEKNGTIAGQKPRRILGVTNISSFQERGLLEIKLLDRFLRIDDLLFTVKSKKSVAVRLSEPQIVQASIKEDNTRDTAIHYKIIRHPSEEGGRAKQEKPMSFNNETLLLKRFIGKDISDSGNTRSTASARSEPPAIRKPASDLPLRKPSEPFEKSALSWKDKWSSSQQRRARSQSWPDILNQSESESAKMLKKTKSLEKLLEELDKMAKTDSLSNLASLGGIKSDVTNEQEVITVAPEAEEHSEQAAGNSGKTRTASVPVLRAVSRISEGPGDSNNAPQSPDSSPDGSQELEHIKQQPETEVDGADNEPKPKKNKPAKTEIRSFVMDI